MATVSEPPRPRGGLLRRLSGLRLSRNTLVAIFLENWMTTVRGQRLGRGFGLVEEISNQDLVDAVPNFDPPSLILPSSAQDSQENYSDFEEGLSEQRKRVSRWAAAITSSSAFVDRLAKIRSRPSFTAVSLVSTNEGVKLAVVDYYPPGRLLIAPGPSELLVGGATFPTFARPFIPEPHSAARTQDGHCWVELVSEHAILTARHVVKPRGAAIGSRVYINSRRVRVWGELLQTSKIMDAAIVKVDNSNSGGVSDYPYSRYPGFKPVRFINGRPPVGGFLEAEIVGMTGFTGRLWYKGTGGREPLAAARMTLSRSLRPGDSGCLVIDIESEPYGHTHPYLIYQGAHNLGHGREGYGLFIAQVANEWSLSTCSLA
ncbi:hypothetical protein [Mycobacterium sp. IEC1808]|uniref:hypothetical protein n=2 Tax=Mycobacterium TaxID=1763 RepID=UPI00114F5AB8|nr:hypothetical protein [Mycobacterium sp. IEC1808]